MFIDMGTIVGDDLEPVDIEEMMSAQAEFIDEDDDREMMTASSGGDTLQLESDNISNDKKDKKLKLK